MKYTTYSVLAGLALLLAGGAAQAQQANQTSTSTRADHEQASADTTKLTEWEYNSIYEAGGIRAEYMLTEEVFGPQGNEIGNVENVILNTTGEIVALIIEVGDFWDIANTDVVVPWQQVKLVPDGFKVPVNEDNYDEYLLFGDDSFVTMAALQQEHPVNEILATGAQTWKLTMLLGDYAILEGGRGYGYVDDVLFSKQGDIMAVIVQSSIASLGFGAYAFPYYGPNYIWQPYDTVYILPWGPAAIKELDPFDYDQFDGLWY